jgi:hypothetical protein
MQRDQVLCRQEVRSKLRGRTFRPLLGSAVDVTGTSTDDSPSEVLWKIVIATSVANHKKSKL